MNNPNTEQNMRRRRLGVLAKARLEELEQIVGGLGTKPAYELLRRPETGLAMVQGRAGGTGARFNLGEVTVTRAAVRLASGTTGFGYVAGRNQRHAELVALIDAMAEDGVLDANRSVEALAEAQANGRRLEAARAAKTKVEFFTMVRGE